MGNGWLEVSFHLGISNRAWIQSICRICAGILKSNDYIDRNWFILSNIKFIFIERIKYFGFFIFHFCMSLGLEKFCLFFFFGWLVEMKDFGVMVNAVEKIKIEFMKIWENYCWEDLKGMLNFSFKVRGCSVFLFIICNDLFAVLIWRGVEMKVCLKLFWGMNYFWRFLWSFLYEFFNKFCGWGRDLGELREILVLMFDFVIKGTMFIYIETKGRVNNI